MRQNVKVPSVTRADTISDDKNNFSKKKKTATFVFNQFSWNKVQTEITKIDDDVDHDRGEKMLLILMLSINSLAGIDQLFRLRLYSIDVIYDAI